MTTSMINKVSAMRVVTLVFSRGACFASNMNVLAMLGKNGYHRIKRM